DRTAGTRVDGPRIIGRGRIEDAVDFERRAFDARVRGCTGDRIGTFAADDRRAATTTAAATTESTKSCRATAGTGRQCAYPGQRQIFHVLLVDLFERTMALPGVIARVSGPVVAERLGKIRRSQRTLRQNQRGRNAQRRSEQKFL